MWPWGQWGRSQGSRPETWGLGTGCGQRVAGKSWDAGGGGAGMRRGSPQTLIPLCLLVWLDESGSCPEDGEIDPEA